MSFFTETLLAVPAKDASKALGIPLRTIYSWRTGQKTPNAWTQKMVTANLLAYSRLQPKARK